MGSYTNASPPVDAGTEVVAERAEHDDGAAGHVLAGVVTDAFDDRGGAAVADAEPLPDPAGREQLAARRAVEDGVAGQHRVAGVVGGGAQDHPAAAHALRDVVLSLADQLEGDAGGEGTRRSSARPTR